MLASTKVEQPIHRSVVCKPYTKDKLSTVGINIMSMVNVFVTLMILYLPYLTLAEELFSGQMELRITSLGATESIRCTKENQGNDLVVWNHNEENVSINDILSASDPDHRNRYSVQSDDANGHYDLQIKYIKPEDTGIWECKYGPQKQVEHLIKSVSIVIPPYDGFPTCDISSSSPSISVGDSFQLTCNSGGGFPPPTLRWVRNGVELSRTNEANVLVLDRLAELSDTDVQYSCEIQSLALKTSRNCTQTVTVKEGSSSSIMFDALAIFGILCGVFLFFIIMMAIAWGNGRSKAIKQTNEKIRKSTETLAETNPNLVRPYSTVTLSSVATLN
ncbi:T-lymphocyte activation antigen CD80-like [Anneissia japonica]|uniref:T-lymphocyte activation antigen CD80-like n=1 Tax=Anneissia japonica TaxID=1529436 RepID=UPI00142579A2|nr:T-lymphocyte activation antigen CD80-like [Anneissia japonica]